MFTWQTSLTKGLASSLHYPLGAITAAAMAVGFYSIVWPANVAVTDGNCYDYIVIGSGAGSVVANRLTENKNVSVLLVEYGKAPSLESVLPGLFFELQNSYQDYSMLSEEEETTVSQSQGVFKIAAGRSLGGSSQIHHLIYLRGDPTDYNTWAEITNDDSWKYENVLPYFKKAETIDDEEVIQSEYSIYHGTTGPTIITRETHESAQKYLNAFKEIGQEVQIDTNGYNTVGYTQPFLTIGNGVRQSTAQAYMKPVAKRSNLNVMYEALVIKINFDDDKNAVSVNILVDGKTITINAAKEIILCAGVFNSPKLLMLSGIGPASDLEAFDIPVVNDLPVGKNLQDHVAVLLISKMEVGKVSSVVEQLPALTKLPFPVIIGAARINQSLPYPEYQSTNLILAMNTPYLIEACGPIFGYQDDICESLQLSSKFRDSLFTLVANIHPKSKGSVVLSSKDPKEQPNIRMNFYSDKTDFNAMVNYVEDFIKVQTSKYFRNVNSELVSLSFDGCEGDFSSREYIECYVKHMSTTLYHQTSTCAMGSVLDSQLKVAGVNRLRVVDASAMPNVPRANPLSSVIMLAEKASDMIKADMNDLECMCNPTKHDEKDMN